LSNFLKKIKRKETTEKYFLKKLTDGKNIEDY